MATLDLDLVAVRAAIAEQIKGSVERQINVYGGYLPPSPEPPCILVEPDEDYLAYQGIYESTGVVTIRIRLRCLMKPGPSVDGQMVLDEFLSDGPNSVRNACAADPKFGGVVNSSHVYEGVRWDGLVLFGLPDSQSAAYSASLFLVLTHHPRS